MATKSYGNTQIIQITTIDTIPLSGTIAGTVTAVAGSTAITGTATDFTTSVGYTGTDIKKAVRMPLGYLWDVTNNEWRIVTSVENDTLLFVQEGFSNALAAATVRHIPASRLKALSFTDTGAGNGVVDGISLVANEGGGWALSNTINNPIEPHIFTNCTVTLSYT